METLSIIISLFGGAAGIGTLLWYILNLRAKKKVENANAELASAEADAKASENWKNLVDKLEHRLEQTEFKLDTSDKKLSGIQRLLTALISRKSYAEYHFCGEISCQQRKPPLGTFSTPNELQDKNETN